jgi:hypothetical protein
MCHTMILCYNGSTIINESHRNVMFFCHFMSNIGFPMKKKLIRTYSVLLCLRFRIYRPVTAPKIVKDEALGFLPIDHMIFIPSESKM